MAEEVKPRAVLVRHGQTEWSRDGKHTSRTDIDLTARGVQQGEALREPLSVFHFGRVLVSPRQRATATARLAGFDDQLERCPDLVEWDYGRYEGRTTAEIRRDAPGWSLWRDGAPGGESAAQVGTRADRVVEAIRREGVDGAGGDALLVAHGHILRVVTARWLGLPPADGRLFYLDTATISILGWERDTPVILLWNEAVPLPEE